MTAAVTPYAGLISIVIPTYERDVHLRRLLDSILADPNRGLIEIFVGDQSAGDRREQILAGLDASPITWFRPNLRSKGYALNTGTEWAHGEVIAYLDDDVAITPQWFPLLREAAAGDPFEVVYGGVNAPRPPEPWELLPRTTNIVREIRGKARGVPMLIGIGANTAGRTEIFRRLRFDEALCPGGIIGSCDDLDFGDRAGLAGVHRRMIPEMAVLHHEYRSSRDGSAQQLLGRYAGGRGGMFAKHVRTHRWSAALRDIRTLTPRKPTMGASRSKVWAFRVGKFARGAYLGFRLPLNRATLVYEPRRPRPKR
ncbi:MAG: glycosyltransferase family 2 protein [Dehalococcoidia bacterium]